MTSWRGTECLNMKFSLFLVHDQFAGYETSMRNLFD